MRDELTISLSVETLGAGALEPPEEKATFGLLSMTANDRLLTSAQEIDGGELRRGPRVAGYPLAEWLVWNWWRIRWECGRPASAVGARDWDFAHRMTSVGEGYAWPVISIFSDGRHASLDSKPSREPSSNPLRYIGAERETISASCLEAGIDRFVADVLARLDAPATRETNLHRLWEELRTEREIPEHARFRRFEAQLGRDPDDVAEDTIRARLDDAATLGEEALGEVAAAAAVAGEGPDRMMSAADFADTAADSGFDADPEDAVTLAAATVAPDAEAWRAGVRMAQKLREREGLDGQPIPDARLAAFAGTTADAVSQHDRRSAGLSFVLDGEGGGARVALRSKWTTGRRFDLARLVGDRMFGAATGSTAELLWPATDAFSYRQKMQRAFAAELLCPFAAVDEMTRSDDSGERQRDVAERFNVSELTVRTQLVNGGRIDRESAPDVAARGAWS